MNRINILMSLVIRPHWRKWLLLFLVIPLLMLIVSYFVLVMNLRNIVLLAMILLNYYFGIFLYLLSRSSHYDHILKFHPLGYRQFYQEGAIARTPFWFIRKFKYNRDYYASSGGTSFTPPLIGAEIGVRDGRHAQLILEFLDVKELILVDPWKVYDEPISTSSRETLNPRESAFWENLYQEVVSTFSDNHKVRIVRDTSVSAARMFDNEYFDFVYLDGDHNYPAVLEDLQAWYPKLKKFGVMCGDDFGHAEAPGVIQAVTEFAYKHQVIVQFGEVGSVTSRENQWWFTKV